MSRKYGSWGLLLFLCLHFAALNAFAAGFASCAALASAPALDIVPSGVHWRHLQPIRAFIGWGRCALRSTLAQSSVLFLHKSFRAIQMLSKNRDAQVSCHQRARWTAISIVSAGLYSRYQFRR